MASRPGVTADELVAVAGSGGFGVTRPQLARWHPAGLLPAPATPGKGRGRGRESVYPVGSGNQLLALLRAKCLDRRFLAIGWRLWWQGFDVSPTYPQHWLRTVAVEWDTAIALTQSTLADDHLTEAMLIEASDAPLHGWAGATRRRLGRAKFTTFAFALAQVFAGMFTGFDEPTLDEPGPRDIATAAFFHPRAPSGAAAELTAAMATVSALSGDSSMLERLEAATEEEVRSARVLATEVLARAHAAVDEGDLPLQPGALLALTADDPLAQATLALLVLAANTSTRR